MVAGPGVNTENSIKILALFRAIRGAAMEDLGLDNLQRIKKKLFEIISFRLVIPVLALSVLVTGVVGYMGLKSIENLQKQGALSIAQSVERYIGNGERMLEAVSGMAAENPEGNLETILDEAWRAYGYFETLYYLDSDRKIEFVAPGNLQLVGLDLSNVPELDEAKGSDRLILSRPFLSLRTGDPAILMIKALPIGGYMVGELNLSILQGEIQKQKSLLPQGTVFIMDEIGTLLGHPEGRLVKEQTSWSNKAIFKYGKFEDISKIYWDQGVLYLGSTQRISQKNWIVVNQVPLKTVFLPYAVGLLFASGVVISLLIGLFKTLTAILTGKLVTPLFHQATTESAFRQKAEAAASETELRFQAIFNQTFQFIGLLDLDGRILEFNNTGIEMGGYGEKELKGAFFGDLPCWRSTEMRVSAIREACVHAAEGRSIRMEVVCPTKEGVERYVDLSIKPFINESGAVTMLISEGRDITEQKRSELSLIEINEQLEARVFERTQELEVLNGELGAINQELAVINQELNHTNETLNEEIKERTLAEEQLALANTQLTRALDELKNTQRQMIMQEKMAALGELVAGIAHEINTPIGIGITAASYLDKEINEMNMLFYQGKLRKQEFEAFIGTAQESSGMVYRNLIRAAELIGSFKNVAVNQSSDILSPFNVKHFTDDILVSMKPKWKNTPHKVLVNCPEKLEMQGYPGAYSQIITNLLMNSFAHGFIDVREGIVKIDIEPGPEGIVLRYSDNGMGIEPEIAESIFMPFFTTKRTQGGTGLGLYIVYNLVTQTFGGAISFKSTLGEGTEFLIVFPYALA